jgi:hypothetical protein
MKNRCKPADILLCMIAGLARLFFRGISTT